jgi:hypothetical protein
MPAGRSINHSLLDQTYIAQNPIVGIPDRVATIWSPNHSSSR